MANVWEAMKKHRQEQAAESQRKPRKVSPLPEPQSAQPLQHTAAAVIASTQTVSTEQKILPAYAAPEPRIRAGAPTAKYDSSLLVHHDRGGKVAEEYRALRTSLLAQCGKEGFCYLVTSAQSGEGKTVTCLNLAMALAERASQRTIVIDADLRRGQIADLLSLDQTPGLAEYLRGRSELKEIIQPTLYENVWVVAAGHARKDEVAELISRPDLDGFFEEIRRMYDFVLVDTPPISKISDAGVLGRWVGEALVVVRMNHTHRESVDRVIGLLHGASIKPAGIVLTHRKYHIPDYIYRVA
jgi:capsular exopolysaccharide synthesis family protein